MTTWRPLLVLLGCVPVTVFAFACSGGRSASAPDEDSGTSSSGGGSGGGDDGGGTGFYNPAGCKYSVTPTTPYPSTSDVYTNMALDTPVAANTSTGAPIRVRVGLGGNTQFGTPGYPDPTTSAVFTWETADQETNAEVKIGTSASALTQNYTGYVFTAPSLGNTTTNFHEVHVCGLTPDTQYYYQVGGGTSGSQVWSATQSFSTMPTGTSNTPITVGIFGDARDTVSTWQAVHVRMKAAGVLMSLIPGDIVDLGEEESLYVQWLDDIWQYPSGSNTFLTLGQQYIIPINGNHENDQPITFANWAVPGDGQYAKTYNSFTVGSVHFTMIDDEQIADDTQGGASTPETTAQLAWIASDLAAANADRANHPFIVVLGHRGLFSTSLHSADSDVLAARDALAPIFAKNNVDMVMNGHDHEYERTFPITPANPATGAPTITQTGNGPYTAANGTTYVICAGAGADPYAVGTSTVAYRATKTAFGSGTPYIGLYSLLQITPTQLTYTAYGMVASGTQVSDDTVIDTVTIKSQ